MANERNLSGSSSAKLIEEGTRLLKENNFYEDGIHHLHGEARKQRAQQILFEDEAIHLSDKAWLQMISK